MLPRHLLVALLALGAAAALSPQTADAQVDPDVGRARFQAGRALYDRGDFSGALTEFRASMLALPSPNTALYIGRSLRELGRLAEAWRALTDASDDARRRSVAEPRYARTAESAYADANALTPRLAFVTVTVPNAPPGTVVELNGRPLEATSWNTPQPVDPPTLTLDARAPGRTPFHTSNSIAPGLQAQLAVTFDAPPAGLTTAAGPLSLTAGTPPPVTGVTTTVMSPWRPIGIVALGLGVVAGVTGIVLGLHARSLESDLQRDCPRGCANSVALQLRIDDGYQATLFTNIAFGASAALLVGGTLATVLGHPTEVNYTPDVARVSPYLDPAHGTAGLRGTF